MNENQQQNELTLSTCLIQNNGKQTSSQLLTSWSSLSDICRPMATSYILEESFRRSMSVGIKPTILSSSSGPLRISSCFQLQSTIFKNENHSIQSLNREDTLNLNNCYPTHDSPVSTNASSETICNDQDETKTLHSISNTNDSQYNSKTRQFKFREIEVSKDTDQSSLNSLIDIYEYKNPFTKEYDQAILLQANNNINECNLKDFYRDVKTQFEPETNTKAVFEKCLKLARLQAMTIKWEQRRRHNEPIYTRSIKSAMSDKTITSASNASFISKSTNNEKDSRDINELKCCNECKRLQCIGTCTVNQEYPQYKRSSQFSSLLNRRDQTRAKFHWRTQRSAMHVRPRTARHATRESKFKSEPTKLNLVVVVPSLDDESQIKRSQKKHTNGFLPGKLIRSQRRETLAILSTNKISS